MKTKVQRGLDRVLDIAEEVGSLSQLGRMMMEDLKEEMMLLKTETTTSSIKPSTSSTLESSSPLSESAPPPTSPSSLSPAASDEVIQPTETDGESKGEGVSEVASDGETGVSIVLSQVDERPSEEIQGGIPAQ